MFYLNGSYSVYVHTNKANGKMYVGQTCQKPERRWAKGEGYKFCTHFYNAIQKYGWDNFEHEVIASNLTLEEANNFEELLIKKLNTLDSAFGYNLRPGGRNSSFSEEHKNKLSEAAKKRAANGGLDKVHKNNCKKVAQYSKDEVLIKVFDSLQQAEKETGIKYQGISRCCRGGCKTAGKYIWRFMEV